MMRGLSSALVQQRAENRKRRAEARREEAAAQEATIASRAKEAARAYPGASWIEVGDGAFFIVHAPSRIPKIKRGKT